MALLHLRGTLDSYLFNPDDDSMVLNRNGKFGSVFAGARASDKKHVIIKMLNPELKKHAIAVEQFSLESKLKLNHPFLRKTVELIELNDEYFLIQEYIPGMSLKNFLQQNSKYRNSVSFITRCAINILNALEYLHSLNIIHCDIKPANILIETKDKNKINFENPPVKLIDLGQAKTGMNDFVAAVKPFSLIYSPPEQMLHFHELINTSSDLYALAISVYELITGHHPFGSAHPEIIMHMQVSANIQEHEKIPNGLYAILFKATAKNQFPLPPNQMNAEEQKIIVMEGMKKRYQQAAEMKHDLENFLISFKERRNLLDKVFR